MKLISPEEYVEEWRRKDRKNFEMASTTLIPGMIGKAAVMLIANGQQITTENLIHYFETELQNSPGSLVESWFQAALQFLKDSVSSQ
ncbi:hypothetical protein DPB66_02540 [Salmonella enterica subsp. enterica serovar Java]|nr:hypothetical protein [Salmonella enterica]EBW3150380.1 hypothetical protein [Salmonella enterica subsp. enterica serovar Java]EDV9851815.1 hypothetical protein [Salmonella enterica subsp. enterica serovar Java]EFS2647597.1 hypothetical protein [Salmonella enterica]ELZ8474909.1 hypothetical protein [Salmonella enterica]